MQSSAALLAAAGTSGRAPLLALAVAVGLLAGGVIAWAAPRLVAYRLADPIPMPGSLVILPVLGGWIAGWRPWRTCALSLATGAILGALAYEQGAGRKLVLAAIYSVLLLTIAYIDLEHRLVLNRLSYPSFLLAIVGSLLWPGLGLRSALLGAAVGLAIFFVLQVLGRGALGTGDTKLALVIGAMCGLPAVFNALLLGTILGGVGAAVALFVLRRGRKSYIAYAPYLALGAILTFL